MIDTSTPIDFWKSSCVALPNLITPSQELRLTVKLHCSHAAALRLLENIQDSSRLTHTYAEIISSARTSSLDFYEFNASILCRKLPSAWWIDNYQPTPSD